MSVFSNIGKNISNKGKEISRKAKVMSETSSLNNIIKGEECKIDTQYKLMGNMYFEKYGSSPEQEFSPAIEAIKNSMEKINETKQEIIKIKVSSVVRNAEHRLKTTPFSAPNAALSFLKKPNRSPLYLLNQKKNAQTVVMYWTQKQFSVMSAEQNLKICLLLQMIRLPKIPFHCR